jgi:hypothetical protein
MMDGSLHIWGTNSHLAKNDSNSDTNLLVQIIFFRSRRSRKAHNKNKSMTYYTKIYVVQPNKPTSTSRGDQDKISVSKDVVDVDVCEKTLIMGIIAEV